MKHKLKTTSLFLLVLITSWTLFPIHYTLASEKVPCSIHRMSRSSLNSVTLYTPEGEVINLASRSSLSELDDRPMIVIGNGGAGHVGLIQYLAERYNKTCSPSEQITIGWKFADSHMNYNSIRKGVVEGSECDLYITYQPAVEELLLKEGHLKKVVRLFNDEFPLIGPSENPAVLAQNGNPAENMKKIIAYSLTQHNPHKKVYYSRWNNSAMGVKDQQLWCIGATLLAKEIINYPSKDLPFRMEIRAQIITLLNTPYLPSSDKEYQIAKVILTNFMENHILKPHSGRVFPAGAITASMEEKLYAISDAALIVKHGLGDYDGRLINSCVVFNHSDKVDIDNILTSPAQLLVPKSFEQFSKESAQRKFLKWLKSEQGKEAISNFIVTGPNPQSPKAHPYNGNVDGRSFTLAVEAVKRQESSPLRYEIPIKD